jgi:signal transduction histidine kinase
MLENHPQSKSKIYLDRIVTPLRWVSLFGLYLFLSWNGGESQIAFILFSALAVWYLFISLLVFAGKKLPQHYSFILLVDIVFSGIFIFATPINNKLFLLSAVLPILSGAFYFGVRGGGLAAISLIVIQTVVIGYGSSLDLALQQIDFNFLIMLASSTTLGVIIEKTVGKTAKAMDTVQKEENAVTQTEQERMKAIYNITTELNATLNFGRVLEMALDLTAQAVASSDDEEDQLVGAFFLFDQDELTVASARRFSATDMNVKIYGANGLINFAINSRESQMSFAPDKDPELVKISALRNCNRVYCYPLYAEKEAMGVLLFGHPDPEFLDEFRVEIFEIVGRQSNVALQNARLYDELLNEKEKMMELQEEAQKKLARNLHDGPTQSVAALAMRVNYARRLLERDVEKGANELFKIEELARRTAKEMRHMLFTLRPLILESSGLLAAFRSMAEKMKETYDENVIVEGDDSIIEEIEMGKQAILFYLGDEAVNNARKHAEAEHIWITLRKVEKDIILLEIRDDGVGFNVGSVDKGYENRGSLGMVNMRERTQMVSGLIKLESAEGEGTRIRIWVPLTEDASERMRSR